MKKRYRKSFKSKKKKSSFSLLRKKGFWVGFFCFIFSATIVYLLLFSPVFKIKKIEVSKTNKVSSKEIKNTIWGEAHKNIFLANFKPIIKNLLEKYPQVENIEIKRKLPEKLFVQIKEREAVAIFSENYLVDKNGIAFEEIKDFNLNRLKIKKGNEKGDIILGEQYIEKKIMEKILKIKNNFDIKEIEIISEERLNAKTFENWQIYFSLKKDIELQLSELKILLRKKIPPEERKNLEHIDLRFEKIYFKESS